MKFSTGQLLAFGGVAVLMAGLGILVALAQQRQDLRERADTGVAANDGVLDCDPGVDPYNSNTITVSNNTDAIVEGIRFDVHRCEYIPGMIEQYRGSFKCEPNCDPSKPECLEGVWDPDASNQGFSLQPGESRTLTATANECEIIQVDAQVPGVSAADCYNVRSQYTVPPGDMWPGGIAFGISENSTGYPTCEQPTPTPSNTPVPSVPPTSTPTSQPTAPPGQPTYTPIPPTPTSYYPTATPIPGLPTATPIPTIPVSGSAEVTAIGILGGVGLLIVAAVLLF